MVKSLIKNVLILGGILLYGLSNAQSPEKLLGLPYVDLETTNFLNTLTTEEPTEEFLPYLRLYRQNYFDDGISIDFNSDIAAYRILLYDSGYSYKQYTKQLPFNIKWGMKLLEIEDLTGVHDPVKGNKFATILLNEDYQMEFFFTSKKLSHLRITASENTLKKYTEKLQIANQMRLMPNGEATEGNVIDGTGTMVWGKGSAVYSGQWSYGLPHGRGQYVDTFGNKYEGDFKLGFFWGQGEFYSKLYQYSYSGSYAMSTKHGEGRIQYANNVKYQGFWVQDNMHGAGVYSVGKRYTYKGFVYNNKLTGKGTVLTPEGTITGSFRNGKPHGICTQTTKDNLQSLTGPFTDGKKNGKFTALIMGEERIIFYENDVEAVPQN